LPGKYNIVYSQTNQAMPNIIIKYSLYIGVFLLAFRLIWARNNFRLFSILKSNKHWRPWLEKT